MAGPITWRNVDAPNPAAAIAPMQVAQQSINGAFDSFGKVLAQRQALDDANFAAHQESLKQSFLDQLASAKTPEQMAALQASGALDAARQGMTPQVAATVRGADEARLASVRTNELAANTFTDQVRAHAEQPIIGAIKDKAISGDIAGAMADLKASNLYDKSGVESFIHDTSQKRQAESEHDKMFPITLDNAVLANKEGKLRLTSAENTAADDAAARAAEQKLADAARVHEAGITAARSVIEPVAKTMPDLPRNTDNTLALDRMTTDQTTRLNAGLKAAGYAPVDQLLPSDTSAAAKFKAQLKADGTKPSVMARIEPAIPIALSNGAAVPIGADADAAQRQLRAVQADDQQLADKYGTIATATSKADLLKAGTDAINAVSKPGSWENQRYGRALAEWIDQGGIPVGKGKDAQRVLPSPAQLTLMLRTVNPNSIFYSPGSDITDKLKAWEGSSEAKAGAAKLLESRLRQQLLNIDPPTKQ